MPTKQEIIRKYIQEIPKKREEQKRKMIERFNNMKPFKTVDDIPEVPIVDKDIYNTVIIPNLIRCGASPKRNLIIGRTYVGDCRNAQEGVWDVQIFVIKRYKFGDIFDDTVDHFEDDRGYDVFVPIGIKE
jgi:hypothetical protein